MQKIILNQLAKDTQLNEVFRLVLKLLKAIHDKKSYRTVWQTLITACYKKLIDLLQKPLTYCCVCNKAYQ